MRSNCWTHTHKHKHNHKIRYETFWIFKNKRLHIINHMHNNGQPNLHGDYIWNQKKKICIFYNANCGQKKIHQFALSDHSTLDISIIIRFFLYFETRLSSLTFLYYSYGLVQ